MNIRNFSAGGEWVTYIVTHGMYQHRNFWMRAVAAPTRDTMDVHSKGHEVGTPSRGCRGTQFPGRRARCPRFLPFFLACRRRRNKNDT